MHKHLLPYRDNFFEDFFTGDMRLPSLFEERTGRLLGFPRIDVRDEAKHLVVTANIPGIAAKDVHIDVEDNMLTLSGSVSREEEEGKKDSDYYRMEREEGSFARTITLPTGVDRSGIEAKTKNGVLTIILPKKSEEQKSRINIREE
ncbi:MAG TPA: Hsp20/alpha crystallin family protein [Candidatus Paceibacterota bacterium]|nr:Hsp20/alpha crystallin family protein [Candidatus Paceibacterota bacterium]